MISCLYGTGFLVVAVIKIKQDTKINVEQEMKVAESNVIPGFEKLCYTQ